MTKSTVATTQAEAELTAFDREYTHWLQSLAHAGWEARIRELSEYLPTVTGQERADVITDLYTAALPLIRTIVSTAISYNVTRQDAEEAVQDAFLQALQDYDPAQGLFRSRLSHYAELKLRNMARKSLARHRTLQAFSQLVQIRTLDPYNEATFWQYVATLEPTLQQAVKKVVAGYSLSAVAKELGYSDMRVLKRKLRAESA